MKRRNCKERDARGLETPVADILAAAAQVGTLYPTFLRGQAYDLGKDLPAVRADAAQLRQIVLNLVTNASEALGDRDGVIRATTKCVEEGRAATITNDLAEGDYLQLEVSDSGSGMSQETQARVFDPFFTAKSSGHGLGLAVVQGIVRGLRGAIHVASEPAKGATFQVLLPCAQTTADANSTPTSGTGESARPSQAFTVLVVEDEDPLRLAVVKMLRNTGFEVLEAANGSAAIELLRTNGGKIDVILLEMTEDWGTYTGCGQMGLGSSPPNGKQE
jgi:hypothetical protein